MLTPNRRPLLLVALLLAAVVGCSSPNPTASPSPSAGGGPLPQGTDPFTLDADAFVAAVDNDYWPMNDGDVWIYRSTDADGNTLRTEMTVTGETREILGISATVVTSEVTVGDVLVRATDDWYAQDRAGNVWYLGREATVYENDEVVGTDGSWEAGVDGALAGVILPGDPQVGVTYRQAYAAGSVEDSAEVIFVGATVEVVAGEFEDALVIKTTSGLDSGREVETTFALDLGPILVAAGADGDERQELSSYVSR